jgi:hypothetical protein
MSQEFFNQFMHANPNTFKAIAQLNRITSRHFAACTEQAFAFANASVAAGVEYAQNLNTIKKMEDLVTLQTHTIKNAGNQFTQQAEQAFNTLKNTSSELKQWVEQNACPASTNKKDESNQ